MGRGGATKREGGRAVLPPRKKGGGGGVLAIVKRGRAQKGYALTGGAKGFTLS